ncbi:hypothetical protein FRB94_013498 [Tulasnella sp. JGI-2019a]|nr:hypothetical protein FRB93_010960 [Tulasnella sp. JGI-2019a]KAG8990279.1 hypothetical protein FRB94_013498 [Tulasnella sp. JGI-2019a]
MLPGSPRYLQNLIHSLVQDTGVPFPSSIFTSLLLCMVAGQKHLILRTPEDDVGEVKALVVRILVTIFGLPTQRIAVRSDVEARTFLNDVFLVPPPLNNDEDEHQKSPGVSPTTLHSRVNSTGRPKPVRRKTLTRTKAHGVELERTEDSASSIGGMESLILEGTPKATRASSQDRFPSISSHTNASQVRSRHGSHSRQPSTGGTSTLGRTTLQSGSPPPSARRPSLTLQSPKWSKTGFLSTTSDDTASTKALRPRSTHGLHIETNPPSPITPIVPLPSPGEYPPPNPGLLRAMSVSSTGDMNGGRSPSPSPRLPHALVLSKLEKAKKSVQQSLAEVMRTGCIAFEDTDETVDDWWNIDITTLDDQKNDDFGGLGSGGAWNLPSGFIVVYVCPLGDGKGRPPIQKCLLDKFAFSAPIRLEKDTYNVSPGPFRRTALISREDIDRLQTLCSSTHISPKLQNYIASLLTAARHHPTLEATLLTARAVTDYADLVRASRVILGRNEQVSSGADARSATLIPETRILSASDGDARRMVMSSLEHRLKVRDGVSNYVLGSLECTAVEEAEDGLRQRGGGKRRKNMFDATMDMENGYDAEQSSMEHGKGRSRWRRPPRRNTDDDNGEEDERPTVQMVLQSILDDV